MTTTEQPRSLLDRIAIDPQVMVGKPTIRGTRIPVELVLEHLAECLDLTDLFEAYPRLTTEDVQACLFFARRALRDQFNPEPVREAAVDGISESQEPTVDRLEIVDFDNAAYIPPKRVDRIALSITDKPGTAPHIDVEEWLG